MVELITIKKIKDKDVTFLKMDEVDGMKWICAYVRITKPRKEEYPNETYRDGEVLGIDTAHYRNQKMTFEQKMQDAEEQITELIEARA